MITGGAICDLWFKDDTAILPSEPIKQVKSTPWTDKPIQTCEVCAFESNGKCLRTGKDATVRCNKFEDIDIIEYDPEVSNIEIDDDIQVELNIGYCKDCAFSEYKGGAAWCRFHEQIIDDVNDNCDDWKQEGSVVIIEGSCKLCYYSYLDGNIPRCNIDEHQIEDIEACCDRYQEALNDT
jgi:hypothetical protein